MLFLFFNCMCSAAPVLQLAGKVDAVALQMVKVPYPLEGEEENHATSSGYINHSSHFSLRKQCGKRLNLAAESNFNALISGTDAPKTYLHYASVFPLPAYYVFLFRYTLF